MTRPETQARTRARLVSAAMRSISKRGVGASTIEGIAQEAGYTRGAFYANFRRKEELLLAVLDAGFGRYVERFDAVLATDDEPSVRARAAGDDLASIVAGDPEGQRLFFELAVHAMRDESFRHQLAPRLRALRGRVGGVFQARADEYGVEVPLPLEQLTAMTFAMSVGMMLEQLVDPESGAAELHGPMFAIFFAGLGAGARG